MTQHNKTMLRDFVERRDSRSSRASKPTKEKTGFE
jgi:hypothetical protein